jgi:transposase-like protein
MKAQNRRWSIEEKLSMLKDIEKGEISEGCRRHEIYSSTYYLWMRNYQINGVDVVILS